MASKLRPVLLEENPAVGKVIEGLKTGNRSLNNSDQGG
jgi:hypothetical protein